MPCADELGVGGMRGRKTKGRPRPGAAALRRCEPPHCPSSNLRPPPRSRAPGPQNGGEMYVVPAPAGNKSRFWEQSGVSCDKQLETWTWLWARLTDRGWCWRARQKKPNCPEDCWWNSVGRVTLPRMRNGGAGPPACLGSESTAAHAPAGGTWLRSRPRTVQTARPCSPLPGTCEAAARGATTRSLGKVSAGLAGCLPWRMARVVPASV